MKNKLPLLLILLCFRGSDLLAQNSDTLAVASPFDEGYFFVGPDDLLKFKGYVQTDAYFPAGASPGNSEFLVRRARLAATGYFQKNFRYMLYARFDRGKAQLNEAYLESRHLPFARIRVGQFKVPFGLSNLTSSSQLGLIDRPLAVDNFSSQYDIGLMLFGGVWRERIEYAVGVFNGRPMNQPEADKGKDFIGRIVLAPFRQSENKFVKDVYFGASASTGRRSEPLRGDYETGAGISIFSFADSTVRINKLQRFGADLQWLVGRSAVKAEYVQMSYGIDEKASADRLTNSGYTLDFTCFLTGEDQQRNSTVKPRKNLDPARGNWGAFELTARYQALNLSGRLRRYTEYDGAQKVTGVSTGLNWYPNDDVKIGVNYQWLDFSDAIRWNDGTYSKANLLEMRFQYQF